MHGTNTQINPQIDSYLTRCSTLFHSTVFIVFFAVVVGLHYLPLAWRVKKLNLVLARYLFYAAWNPSLVALLWVSTVVDWLAARVSGTA